MKRVWLLLLLVPIVPTFILLHSGERDQQVADQSMEEPQEAEDQQVQDSAPKSFKILTGNEYKQLFLDSSRPNTKTIIDPPSITGNVSADNVIREIARSRGYLLQVVPQTTLNKFEGDSLQENAIIAWQNLRNAASSDGIGLEITSAFRSIEQQQALFSSALSNNGITVSQIISRAVDSTIDEILKVTAPPGYSRHHSGYAIDVATTGYSVFEFSPGFDWLSANNYLNAKNYGFMPSYPDGAENQGPNPEAWEYVWVGKSLLLE